jgi:hypothetical protein
MLCDESHRYIFQKNEAEASAPKQHLDFFENLDTLIYDSGH